MMVRHRSVRHACTVVALAAAISTISGCDDAVTKANDAASNAAKSAGDAATKAASDAAKSAGDAATKAAGDAAKSAGDAATKAADAALDSAKSAVDATKDATLRAWADLGDKGELSQSALKWMSETAQSIEIREIIAKGVQVAPVALELAKTLNAAVDSETAIEPIYQPVGDAAAVDKAIGAMPRVEVIDGLNVGFSQLSRVDAGTSLDETAYLVTWRRDTHVVGLVYRTKRTIDFDVLIKDAPRLIALTQSVLAEQEK
jgi:hypothetical protein